MTTGNFTQEQISALQDAYASGELSVQYNGRRVQYRSLAEMEQILARMKSGAASMPQRRHRAIFDKGV